jgi:hypothetical protein
LQTDLYNVMFDPLALFFSYHLLVVVAAVVA